MTMTTTMGCAHPRRPRRPCAAPVLHDRTRRDPAGASRRPRAPPAHDTSFAGTVHQRRTTARRRPLSAADASRRLRRTLAGYHRSRARPRMLLLLRARRGVRRARDRCERLPCREPLVCFSVRRDTTCHRDSASLLGWVSPVCRKCSSTTDRSGGRR
jgi:hypothetical protein